jgi:hypothetical protein
VIALSSTLGLMRLRYGARIEAIDGKLSAMTFEIFAGIAKLRAAAAEPRTFERWYAKVRRVPPLQFRQRPALQLRGGGALAAAAGRHHPGARPGMAALGRLRAHDGAFVAFHAAMLALLGGCPRPGLHRDRRG